MRKKINLTAEFLHPNSRLLIRGMQITCLAIDRISEMETKREKFNRLSALSTDND